MGTYITIADVDQVTIKDLYTNGNEDYIQKMIDAVNTLYEEKAMGSFGIAAANIKTPVPQLVKDWLLAELNWRVGSAYIISNDPQGSYQILHNLGMTHKERLEPLISADVITGGVTAKNVIYKTCKFVRS